jgi:hypothetical protein
VNCVNASKELYITECDVRIRYCVSRNLLSVRKFTEGRCVVIAVGERMLVHSARLMLRILRKAIFTDKLRYSNMVFIGRSSGRPN